MNITHEGTLRQIIRNRPLSIAILEMESAYQCWERLDETLSEFCRQSNLDFDALAKLLDSLPVVASDTGWNVKPMYHLVDHLTQNHRDFRVRDMPSIVAMLREQSLPQGSDGYAADLLGKEFATFQKEFIKHMEEEETFLFPKIIRNEACFRHPELSPEVYKGSVNLFLKMETYKPELEFKRKIASIREKVRKQMLQVPAAEFSPKTQASLGSFEARLIAHADLETNTLFPRAGRLEQELYESSVPGFSRYPGDQ